MSLFRNRKWLCSEAGLRERVSVSSELISGLRAPLGGLLGLLLRGEGIDLLAGLEEAAVVLVLELGADVVEGHQRGCSFEVLVDLIILLAKPISKPAPRQSIAPPPKKKKKTNDVQENHHDEGYQAPRSSWTQAASPSSRRP